LQDSDITVAYGPPHRCALSGPIENAIEAIRKKGKTDGAESLQKVWSGMKAGGAQEGAYVVYSMEVLDCPSTDLTFQTLRSPTQIFNIVVKFDNEEHATAAYQSGAISGGATPIQIATLPGSQIGRQTGLGNNSWIVSTDAIVPDPTRPEAAVVPSASAAWSTGKYCSILTVLGGRRGELQELARKVTSRQ
jgi:hypothetical protein